MKTQRLQNSKNVITGYLNVNSLRNNIIAGEELMRQIVDICLFSETKLDETFSDHEFQVHGYKMNRRYRSKVEFFVMLMKIFLVKW